MDFYVYLKIKIEGIKERKDERKKRVVVGTR